jgi:hypothetical protein
MIAYDVPVTLRLREMAINLTKLVLSKKPQSLITPTRRIIFYQVKNRGHTNKRAMSSSSTNVSLVFLYQPHSTLKLIMLQNFTA